MPHDLHIDLSPAAMSPGLSSLPPPSTSIHRATNIDTLELLSQTSSIFNMLSEMLELGGGQMLPADAYTQLVAALSQLVAAPIDPNDARSRRIPEALAQITARGSKWPFAVRGKAKLLQRTWEVKYGKNFAGGRESPRRRAMGSDISSEAGLGRDLGTPRSGSMRKLHQILDLPTPVKAVRHTPDSSPHQAQPGFAPRRLARSRSLNLIRAQKAQQPPDPLQCGHLNFKVGDWWTRPLAAKADGIIDSTTGITADDEGAYAVIIIGDQEVATGQIWRSRYRSGVNDRHRKKLLRNLRTQDPVRLLRTATQTIDVKKGEFKLKPRAGVRYDGLYRVTGYSVKKEKGDDGKWAFDFNLERLGNQPALDRALMAPTEEQIRASSLEEHDGEDYEVDEQLTRIIESRRTSLVGEQGAGGHVSAPDSLNVFDKPTTLGAPMSPRSPPSPFS